MAETARVARVGYREVSTRENSMFNLLTSFAATFILVRSVTYALRRRPTVGPFRNLRVGRRHIHHFVPGIVIAFAAGAAAILTRDERLEPWLAVPFGVGHGADAGRVGAAARPRGRLLEPRGSPERADHAGGDGDAGRAGARAAVPAGAASRWCSSPPCREPVRGEVRAWAVPGATACSASGTWTFYWFYGTRRLLDGELGRGRDDALLHTLGLLVPVLNIFVLYWLYRDLDELRRRPGCPGSRWRATWRRDSRGADHLQHRARQGERVLGRAHAGPRRRGAGHGWREGDRRRGRRALDPVGAVAGSAAGAPHRFGSVIVLTWFDCAHGEPPLTRSAPGRPAGRRRPAVAARRRRRPHAPQAPCRGHRRPQAPRPGARRRPGPRHPARPPPGPRARPPTAAPCRRAAGSSRSRSRRAGTASRWRAGAAALAAYLIDGLILLVPAIVLTVIVVAIAAGSDTGAIVTGILGFLAYLVVRSSTRRS